MLQEGEQLSLPELPDRYFFRVKPWYFFETPGVKVQLRRQWRWGSGSFRVDTAVSFKEMLEVDTDAELAVALARQLRDGLARRQRKVDLSGLA